MAKPCDDCGAWVERLPDGRAYNDDGTWHADTCVPNPFWKKKRALANADFKAKHMKLERERREDRGFRRLFGPGAPA